MPRAGPPYSPEFRAEAVRRLTSGGTTVAELSRELGVSESTLHRWRLQAGDHRGESAGVAARRAPSPRGARAQGPSARHGRKATFPRPSRRERSAVGGSPSAIRERTDPCGYLRGSPQMSSTSVWSSSPRPPGGRRAACAGTRTGRTSRPRSREWEGRIGAWWGPVIGRGPIGRPTAGAMEDSDETALLGRAGGRGWSRLWGSSPLPPTRGQKKAPPFRGASSSSSGRVGRCVWCVEIACGALRPRLLGPATL